MAKGGGSLGGGKRTRAELPEVPNSEELSPLAQGAQRLLRSATENDGGRFGLPPELTGQIPVDGIDIGALTDFAAEWLTLQSEVTAEGDRYHNGRPGLWHCFDDLYPLQDPNRWNEIRESVADELQSRGWERSSPRSAAWRLPRSSQNGPQPNGFLLTFNPSKWDWAEDDCMTATLATASGQTFIGRWSVGRRTKGIEPGDRAYLLQQGSSRGIVASGSFTSGIFQAQHWGDPRRLSSYADLDWDVVLEDKDRLPLDRLKDSVPQVKWNYILGSGNAIPPAGLVALESVWRDHVDSKAFISPEEVSSPESFTEGAVTTVSSNRYERDRRARSRCIQHWGTRCAVCDMDFESKYGSRGKDFIHVHHIRELSCGGGDLMSHVPVCFSQHGEVLVRA